jgi:NAD(P)-dependent dehydrogenase (short-subunit alcohol dehydrogenase family)
VDLQLAGKRAIVTGGSRGIGLAVASALVAEGVRVAVVARGKEALDMAARKLMHEHIGGHVVAVPADTTSEVSVEAMVETVEDALGGVDILVNAAAQPADPTAPKVLAGLRDDDLRREVETKVLGYLRCARAVAPGMQRNGWGRIVNISGLAARQSGSAFGSIRNIAVAALTKNLADELGPHGINVTVVHPGLTVTERIPGMVRGMAAAGGISEDEARARLASGVSIGRLVDAFEVADVVTFLCSPRSVAINGDAIATGGGVRGPIYY